MKSQKSQTQRKRSIINSRIYVSPPFFIYLRKKRINKESGITKIEIKDIKGELIDIRKESKITLDVIIGESANLIILKLLGSLFIFNK